MKPFDDRDSHDEARDKRDFDTFPFLPNPVPPSAPTSKVEGSVVLKMSVGAVVMTAMVATVAIRVIFKEHGENAKIDPYFAMIVLLSSAIVGAMIGGLLALKDRVQRKIEKGEYVSQLIRLLFGSSEASLAIWISLIFLVCLIVIPVILALRPF